MNRWYEDIPYGPLTREDFDRLSTAFYDASRMDEQRVAEQRGIRSGEMIGLRVGEMIAKADVERAEIDTAEQAPEKDPGRYFNLSDQQF